MKFKDGIEVEKIDESRRLILMLKHQN